MQTVTPDRAVNILESKLLTRCSYYNKFLDCDKCQRVNLCQEAWDSFINKLEFKKVQSSVIDRALRNFEGVL